MGYPARCRAQNLLSHCGVVTALGRAVLAPPQLCISSCPQRDPLNQSDCDLLTHSVIQRLPFARRPLLLAALQLEPSLLAALLALSAAPCPFSEAYAAGLLGPASCYTSAFGCNAPACGGGEGSGYAAATGGGCSCSGGSGAEARSPAEVRSALLGLCRRRLLATSGCGRFYCTHPAVAAAAGLLRRVLQPTGDLNALRRYSHLVLADLRRAEALHEAGFDLAAACAYSVAAPHLDHLLTAAWGDAFPTDLLPAFGEMLCCRPELQVRRWHVHGQATVSSAFIRWQGI